MKRCKKILSLFMAMMMVVSFLPSTVFADEVAYKTVKIDYSVEGKEFDPYISKSVNVESTKESLDRSFVESLVAGPDMADYKADKDSYPIKDGVVKVYMKKIKKLEEVILKFSDDGSRDIAAGYSLTAQSNVNSIPGSVYEGFEKEGYALTGWQCGNINFNAGATVTFEEMAKAVGDNFTSDNKAYLTFSPIWTAKLNTVEVKFVQDIAGVQKEVAGAITVNAASDNFMNGSVYPEFEVKGSVLKGWKVNNVFFAAGQKVKLADFAAIVGTNFDAEGKAVLSAYPVWETKAELKTVTVKFVQDKAGEQKEVAAPITVDAASDNFMNGSVYPEFEVKGSVLKGWKVNNVFFAAGQKVKLADFAAIVGTNFDAEGKAVLSAYPVWETKAELKTVTVKFVQDKAGVQKEVAASITLDAASDNFMNGSVYPEFEVKGSVLKGWKVNNVFFAAGQKVKLADFAAIVGTNFDAEGKAVLSAYPVWETKSVINEITIKFVENKDGVQKEVAGSFVLNAKNAENSMYDSVYKEFEVKGYHLAGWKFGDNFFKAGQKVTFAEMSKIVGKNFDKYGKAVLAFVPVFEKDAVAQLRSITIKYLEDKVGPQAEVAAGNTIARDDFTFMAGSVYKEFERQGYKLSGWKCGDRFFKAGQKVDFAVLAEIVGDNFIDGSDAVLAFVPVFDKVNNPDVPQGGGSSQKPSTPADKQPTGRPNVNTGVALF